MPDGPLGSLAETGTQPPVPMKAEERRRRGRLSDSELEGWRAGGSVLGGNDVVRFPDELHSMWGSMFGSSHSLHAPHITPRPVHTHAAC